MPVREKADSHAYYNTSPECWNVYTEVLEAEYSDAVLFGNVHQLTVDSYAVQHAGGIHPDKSVVIHLIGLHLVYVRGIRPTSVAPQLQQVATGVKSWPHFEPPTKLWALTVADVALVAGIHGRHASAVREWSEEVWRAWAAHHAEIAALAARHLVV